ncbi:MAG: efflux RND transporter permease subunit [Desulfobulbaceae bacterium]|nr:MAG: efflux RND transporter permease subunit [Desulfobulbaceae bacterium]
MTSFLRTMLKKKAFANAVMFVLIIGGLISGNAIRQELYPTQEARTVEIIMNMQGASPDEIDKSILQIIENSLQGIDGVKRIESEAKEGVGRVKVLLLDNSDTSQLFSDIKSVIEQIDTLPAGVEPPVITIPAQVEKALSLIIYGDQPHSWLLNTAKTIRDDLRTGFEGTPGLHKVELAFPRNREISVELTENTLRQYGFTLEEVADTIANASLDLAGGTLLTEQSDIVLRTSERRETIEQYRDIVVAKSQDGIPVRIEDIAQLSEGFSQSTLECWFNGLPAIQLDVYAVGKETPTSVEKTVQEYLDTTATGKFQGVELAIFENQAAAYRDRLKLLIDNAFLGLLLVLIILGLFLTPKVAFWVMVGIPTSLIGGLILLPLMGGTLNMLSLFAFIVTIGVVVDDAIMIGEAIHTHQMNGLTPLEAAVKGVKEMGGLVFLATITTITAFLPMFFVPGEMGVLFHQIPAVVVAVLIVSLLESILILSTHISTNTALPPYLRIIEKPQQKADTILRSFIAHQFRPLIRKFVHHPVITLAAAISIVLITASGIAGGLLGFSFTPTIDSDTAIAQATLPYGTPKEKSVEIANRLIESGRRVLQENQLTSTGMLSVIGTRLDEGEVEVESLAGTHYISALIPLPPEHQHPFSTREFAAKWQQAFGSDHELEALNFTGETNVTGGEPILLEVFHSNPAIAQEAALHLGERMRLVGGLTSVDDGVRTGKPEIHFKLKNEGLDLGVTTSELAKQLRHRFHGSEALRFVKDGDEVKVMVRLHADERKDYGILSQVLLKNSSGVLVPLTAVADIQQARSFTTIKRRDGKRIYPVTADIAFGISDDDVEEILETRLIPELLHKFPGVSVHFAGESEENDEALSALANSFVIVSGIIFLLLVFHFNSFILPLIIMITIPFSCIGAVWGHILMGYDLSIISVIGLIAMAGVVVNDSLVLVTTYTRYLSEGASRTQAIIDAGCNRFRPILLTSLTTFFGLVPLLMETSEQAQFLIPAAISISFGLLVGTFISLVLVPVLLAINPQPLKASVSPYQPAET